MSLNEDQNPTAPGFDPGALIIAAVLALIAAIILYNAYFAPAAAGYARVGPWSVPRLIGAGLAFLSIWTFIAAFRKDFPEREPQNYSPMLWIVGGLAAQMLLLKLAGFSIATGLLFAATAKAFGRGPLWLTVPFGIGFALVVWLIFALGLKLSLPAGPLELMFRG